MCLQRAKLWLFICDCCFFFFKQKTAYEMRISDWSSDVCSSDLCGAVDRAVAEGHAAVADADYRDGGLRRVRPCLDPQSLDEHVLRVADETGRASCRERVCQYV